jgi:AbiTii-like protein
MSETPSKSEHVIALAKELLDDIELSRLPSEALLLKTMRLARLTGSQDARRWLILEMIGYNESAPDALKFMNLTGRWINQQTKQAYWGSLTEQEITLATLKQRVQTLQMPNISDYQTALQISSNLHSEFSDLLIQIRNITAVRGRVIGLLHGFVSKTYYEKVYSSLSGSIFEQYRFRVDSLLAQRCGDVIEKIPSVYARLAEGNSEAISQALTTCRRIIDSFADATYPPSDTPLEVDGKTIKIGPQEHLNRIETYIRSHVSSDSRRTRLSQAFKNLYKRVCAGVHSDVSGDEARALFLETYLLLGETLTLFTPPPPAEDLKNNPLEENEPNSGQEINRG